MSHEPYICHRPIEMITASTAVTARPHSCLRRRFPSCASMSALKTRRGEMSRRLTVEKDAFQALGAYRGEPAGLDGLAVRVGEQREVFRVRECQLHVHHVPAAAHG